jgi:arylsulfatase
MRVLVVIGLGWFASGGPFPGKPAAFARQAAEAVSLDRSVLPIPEPQYQPSSVLDARNAKAPPRFEVKAPPGAPNVLIVLIDDMGFGQSSAFGGPIQMPTLERLAGGGLRYNHFLVNGTKVAEGRIASTQGGVFSADEGADVGMDAATPVTED